MRRWVIGLIALALLVLACKTPARDTDPAPTGSAPARGLPSSMVALGDSLTTGFGSCLAPTSCPRNSWSTGDGLQVWSHYRRILDENPAIKGRQRNLAVPGATASDLRGQAAAAAQRRVDYVTVLIGANDACRGAMTPVATYRTQLDQALTTIRRAMPKARVLFASLPDIYRVWEIGHTNKVARAAWRSGICPNLLTNPTSTEPADVARRQAFRDRIAAYNREIRGACRAYGSRCRYADVASFAFDLNMLSAIDFFHPNAAGQEALAEATYPGRFTW
ncbi:MAG TPA: GDSL-type esterase/lipase family protein [Micromonosporaceae bacterium]